MELLFINYLHSTGDKKFLLQEQLKAIKEYSLFSILKKVGYTLTEEYLYQKNVFDVCVEMIRQLDLHCHQPQYIRFFLDEVNDYLVNKTGSVNDFLVWWEKRRYKASLIIPEGTNAVRIMTIHKAKGLEFPVVILPFTNWETFKAQNIWVDIQDESIDLTTGLFNTTNALIDGGYDSVLSEEQNNQKLDNLNLLYVAFTRAAERLHIIALRSKTQKKETVARWIEDYCLETFGPSANGLYELGVLENKKDIREKETMPLFDIPELHFNSNPNLINIKGAHKLKLNNDSETTREKGIKMHYILSEINSEKDIEPVLIKMTKLGLINSDEKKDLAFTITGLIHNSTLKKYFTGELTVKNEVEIITGEGEILRPDKIVLQDKAATIIDYKTGKQNTKAYLPQMNKYYQALVSMGFSTVKNILVYIEENVVEELN